MLVTRISVSRQAGVSDSDHAPAAPIKYHYVSQVITLFRTMLTRR